MPDAMRNWCHGTQNSVPSCIISTRFYLVNSYHDTSWSFFIIVWEYKTSQYCGFMLFFLVHAHTKSCQPWQRYIWWHTYVRWSSWMSRMSGILILRYNQLKYEIPFVPYCFQLDKIVYIFGHISPILMGFSAKQNKNLIVPDITHFTWLHHVCILMPMSNDQT